MLAYKGIRKFMRIFTHSEPRTINICYEFSSELLHQLLNVSFERSLVQLLWSIFSYTKGVFQLTGFTLKCLVKVKSLIRSDELVGTVVNGGPDQCLCFSILELWLRLRP